MNERIQELANKANEEIGYTFKMEDAKQLHELMEKFAELIIQKCIEEAGNPADGLILDNTWHDGVRASVWSIKRHFGVEE